MLTPSYLKARPVASHALAEQTYATYPADASVAELQSDSVLAMLSHGLSPQEMQQGYTATVLTGDELAYAEPFAQPAREAMDEVGIELHAQDTFINAFQAGFKEELGVGQSVRHANQATKDRQRSRSLAVACVFDQRFDQARLDRLSCDIGRSVAQATGLDPADVALQLARLGQETLASADDMLRKLDLFNPSEQQQYRRAMTSFSAYVGACIERVKVMGYA